MHHGILPFFAAVDPLGEAVNRAVEVESTPLAAVIASEAKQSSLFPRMDFWIASLRSQ
jgi:hypothetical protein